MQSGSYFLKTLGGKCLHIRRFPGSGQVLSAIEAQRGESADVQNKKCIVLQHETNTDLMFSFEKDSVLYLLKVDGGKLKLEPKADKADTTDSSYWFKIRDEGRSEHFMLCTVAAPERYFAVDEKSQVTLADDTATHYLVVTFTQNW